MNEKKAALRGVLLDQLLEDLPEAWAERIRPKAIEAMAKFDDLAQAEAEAKRVIAYWCEGFSGLPGQPTLKYVGGTVVRPGGAAEVALNRLNDAD